MTLQTPTIGLLHLSVGLSTLTALVWGTLATSYCRCHGTSRPQATVLRLFRLLAWLFATYYASKAVSDLLLGSSGPWFGLVCGLAEMSAIILLPVMRHLVLLGTLGVPRPRRSWLGVNYGLGLGSLLMSFWAPMGPGLDVMDVYLPFMTALILWDLVKLARQRRRPILMADLKFGGYLAFAIALFTGVIILLIAESGGVTLGQSNGVRVVAHGFVGLLPAAPFALRILGEMMRGLLVNGLRLALAMAIFQGFTWLTTLEAAAGTTLVLGLTTTLVAMVALGPGSRGLSRIVDALLLRNKQDWRRQLRAVVQGLAPEAGIETVCQRSTASTVEILGLRGVAILLTESRRVVSSGAIDIEDLVAPWTEAAEAEVLPEGVYDLVWLDDVELQTVLHDAKVTWVGPINSPSRRWGYLFVAAGLFGSAGAHAKLEILADLCRELGLILDAADSLARVRRAERELANSEKLAALGESAARIAHEIRNPVTAARSLAQLMAQEPSSPLNAEHADLVVRELDRVEARVQAMLQFAKPETYHFEPICLADEVQRTMAELATYPSIRNVELDLQVVGEDWVMGDAERLRQVLVNLVANGVDALAEPGHRRLGISLAGEEGSIALRVRDSGRGISPEILPRLFDPFVSSKARGAGLGLAIAKRIVEDHGGCIEVSVLEASGTEFCVRLPIVPSRSPAAAAVSLS